MAIVSTDTDHTMLPPPERAALQLKENVRPTS